MRSRQKPQYRKTSLPRICQCQPLVGPYGRTREFPESFLLSCLWLATVLTELYQLCFVHDYASANTSSALDYFQPRCATFSRRTSAVRKRMAEVRSEER